MTGPEHYREAERLLGIRATSDPRAQEAGDRLTAKAQVHATLALAAATALGYDHVPTRDYETWLAAAGTPPQDGAS